METGLSVKVVYWSEQISETQIIDFEGIDDFKKVLSENYISIVQGRPGDLGGLYDMVVDFASNITLAKLVEIVLEGAVFDMIKTGTNNFILQPFIQAYRALKEKNKESRLEISELNIAFQDTTLKIYQIGTEDILYQLDELIPFLANEYRRLILPSGEKPYEIHIPVFEDPSANRLIKYRCLLDVDETIGDFKSADYFTYWGIMYDYARQNRVYNIRRHVLLDDEFYTQEMYLQVWENKQ